MLPSPRLLAAARILAGLSQDELARAAHVGISTVKRLEIGLNAPNAGTLRKLQLALTRRGVQFTFDPEEKFEGIRRTLIPQSGKPSETNE